MRKYPILILLTGAVFVFSYCSSSKKAAKAESPKVAYENSIQTLVVGNCSPCHIPEKGGKKKAYDNFANVKSDIDDIIRRIEMEPHERGFMPFKKEKLSDSTIAVFKKWKEDGLLEK